MRVGVLASGSGTILEAILADGIPITAVVAGRKCRALDIARDAGVEAVLVERTDFSKDFDWAAYCDDARRHHRVSRSHDQHSPGVAFKGWHAVRDALDAGVKVTGCTVHVMTD